MKNLVLIFSFVFTLFFTNTTFASNKSEVNLLKESKKELFVSSDKVGSISQLKSIQKNDDLIIIIIETDDVVIIIIAQ